MNHSNEIRTIQMHILSLKRDSNHLNANSNPSNVIRRIRMRILTLKRDSNHLNAILNVIRNTQLHILIIEKEF